MVLVQEGHGRPVRRIDQSLEEQGLGVEVARHGAVVVEVILRHVGQRGDAEEAAIEAPLLQRMRRRL